MKKYSKPAVLNMLFNGAFMATKQGKKALQNTSRKNLRPVALPKKAASELVTLPANLSGSLTWRVAQYFKYEVTAAESSQAVQRHDLTLFVAYLGDDSSLD